MGNPSRRPISDTDQIMGTKIHLWVAESRESSRHINGLRAKIPLEVPTRRRQRAGLLIARNRCWLSPHPDLNVPNCYGSKRGLFPICSVFPADLPPQAQIRCSRSPAGRREHTSPALPAGSCRQPRARHARAAHPQRPEQAAATEAPWRPSETFMPGKESCRRCSGLIRPDQRWTNWRMFTLCLTTWFRKQHPFSFPLSAFSKR